MIMKDVLEDLLGQAPEGAQLQLQIGGATIAGAVRRSPQYDGMYELLTVADQEGKPIMVASIFAPEDVQVVFVPYGVEDMPATTKSGLIIPGMQ